MRVILPHILAVVLGGLRASAESTGVFWEAKLKGRTSSPPALNARQGVVYVGTDDRQLHACNASNGDVIWSYKTDAPILAIPKLTPDGSKVIGASSNGTMFALDSSSGLPLWTVRLGGPIMHSAPALSFNGDSAYVGSDDSSLYKISTLNGSVAWTFKTDGAMDASPVLSRDNSKVLVGSWDKALYAVSASNGSMLWKAVTDGQIVSSPAITDDVLNVVVGTLNRTVYCFAIDSGGKIWSRETEAPILSTPVMTPVMRSVIVAVGSSIYALSQFSGMVLWKTRLSNSTTDTLQLTPSPERASVFVGSPSGELYRIKALTGDKEQIFNGSSNAIAKAVVSPDSSSLFVSSGDKSLVAIALDLGREVWTYPAGLLLSMSTYPVLSADGSLVFVATEGQGVQAIRTKDGTAGWSKYMTVQRMVVAPQSNLLVLVTSRGAIRALSGTNGTMLWDNKALVDQVPAGWSGGMSVSPSNEVTLVSLKKLGLLALNTYNGTALWTLSNSSAPSLDYPAAFSRDGSLAFVTSSPHNVLAVNLTNGLPVWNFTAPGQGKLTGSPISSKGGMRVFVPSEDAGIFALNSSTGEPLWTTSVGGRRVDSGPAVTSGVIFVGAGGYVFALNTRTGDIIWRTQVADGATGGLSVSPDGKFVYVGGADNLLYALNTSDGTPFWKYDAGFSISAPPVATRNGSLVVVATDNGHVSGVRSLPVRAAVYPRDPPTGPPPDPSLPPTGPILPDADASSAAQRERARKNGDGSGSGQAPGKNARGTEGGDDQSNWEKYKPRIITGAVVAGVSVVLLAGVIASIALYRRRNRRALEHISSLRRFENMADSPDRAGRGRGTEIEVNHV